MDCKHKVAIRYIDYATSRAFWETCLNCGVLIRRLKKVEIEERANIIPVPYDESIKKRWDEKVSAEYKKQWDEKRELLEAEKRRERQAWFEKYNAYLKTPKWRQKRQAVLLRDSYLCQSCRINRADEVHHLTYKHVFDEPLFDLTSVCKECHDKITDMDRNE